MAQSIELDLTPDDLKLFRVEHAFTQSVMANKMGLGLRAYQDLESGAAPIHVRHARAFDLLAVMYPEAENTAPHARLLQWRLHLGVSLEDVARSAGVLPEVISDVEGGRSGYSLRLIQRAAKALAVPFGTLIGQSPPGAGDADLMATWAAIPEERRGTALRVLRALTVEG